MERIQPFRSLLAMYADGIVARASENLTEFLGVSAAAMIGRKLDELIDMEILGVIRERQAALSDIHPTSRIFGVKLRRDQETFDLSLHRSGFLYVLEGEYSGAEKSEEAALQLRTLLGHLSQSPSLDQFHRDAARFVRSLTGFDRVLIYQFEASGSGHVIAEDIAPDATSFLGLRYPASDIPSQARELYLRNAFRIISDIDAEPVPIIPFDANDVATLDLTFSITRAVSPIHLEYLRNMGVLASLSVSIIVGGKLWGLVVCHHRQPKRPGFAMRTAIELFGQMYALALQTRLATRLAEEDRDVRLEAFSVVESVVDSLASMRDLSWVASVIEPYIKFDGIALMIEGQLLSRGLTPDVQVIRKIIGWLNSAMIIKPFATDNYEWQGMAKSSLACRGLFAIPLSNTSHDFILLFRREHVTQLVWGGNPNKASRSDDGRPYLSPRTDFSPFMETVTGQAEPYLHRELRAADILKEAFGVALTRHRGGARSYPRWPSMPSDEIVFDLKARLPALFGLVRGLIARSAPNDSHIAAYCDALGGRMKTLAVADDQLFDDGSKATSLQALLKGQIDRSPLAATRVEITGPEQYLLSQAVLPMALVIHELLSNALAHGAPSKNGKIDISLDRLDSGLRLVWRERGEPLRTSERPRVQAASLNLITRVVTDDLQGRSEIEFLSEGLAATLWLPDAHLAASLH